MLLDLRETVRNSKPIKYTLITIICIPFALVGIGSYLGGSAYSDVAEVDGVPINELQVDRAYNTLKGQYQQMFGGSIPQNLFPDETIRSQALDSLVTEIVVNNTVEEQKFAVGDETLGRAIRNNPQFQVDGKFDSERYQNMIQGSLDSVGNYEESLRASEAVTQFRAGIAATNFDLPNETERLEALRSQTRTIDYVTYSIEKAIENIEVTDEQINTYFDEHAEEYKFPQRAKLEYIELKKSDLAAAIEISDEEVEAHYNDNNSDFVTTPAVRETSHILLEIADAGDADEVAAKTEELEAIKARIAAGESFADLAKEFSDDIGSAQAGGSMGLLEGGYLESQYVEAANQMVAVDELSGIVKTRFGVHLIKLDKYEPEVITPFEDAKEDIVSLLQNNAADTEFLELRTAMEESVASDPESLEVAADASNVEIMTSDWIDVDTQGDDSTLSHPLILEAAFSEDVLENKNNSDLLELNPGHVVSIRTIEHEGPRPKTLEDVKDDVTDTLKRQGAEEQLEEAAKSAVALMLKGTPVSKVAKDNPNATAVADEMLTRDSTVLDANVVREIYALAKPAEGKVLVKSAALLNGDRVAYALKAVEIPEPETAEGDSSEGEAGSPGNAPSQQMSPASLGQAELAAVIANLREKADITIQQ